jgi:DNA-directed RNA polymerase subunit RPC12/RpoP
MSAEIGPGDWVEALITVPGSFGCQTIVAGELYRVRAINENDWICTDCGHDNGIDIELCGDSEGDDGEAWCPCAFRPIYRPRTSLIEDLSRPVEMEPA